MLAGSGPGIDVRYVPGVSGIQRDGHPEEDLAQGKDRFSNITDTT